MPMKPHKAKWPPNGSDPYIGLSSTNSTLGHQGEVLGIAQCMWCLDGNEDSGSAGEVINRHTCCLGAH